jgi:hypothetical protein
VLDKQQPQDGLNWRGMPSPVSRMGKASGQVSFDLLEELIILEQDIEMFEHRVGLPHQFGYPRKDIFWSIAANEQRRSHLGKLSLQFYRSVCSVDKLNQLMPFLMPAETFIDEAAPANSGDDLAPEPLERSILHRKLILLVAICIIALAMMVRVVSRTSISQALRLNED